MAEIRNQAADARDRILSVAQSLFMAQGHAGTSLRMITAKAKTNLAAVNRHFEQIIEAIFAPVMNVGREPLTRGGFFPQLLGLAFSEWPATTRSN
ncbi:MAG TPA: TetR family transcriptional regulator [Burkholderiales bacterium]|nr:TetR family transcriptional regulator [Burkholderiales bacterium]